LHEAFHHVGNGAELGGKPGESAGLAAQHFQERLLLHQAHSRAIVDVGVVGALEIVIPTGRRESQRFRLRLFFGPRSCSTLK